MESNNLDYIKKHLAFVNEELEAKNKRLDAYHQAKEKNNENHTRAL